jgi:hypothetical protein
MEIKMITRRSFLSLLASTPIFARDIAIDIENNQDIYVSQMQWLTFQSALERLIKVRKYVGYGHFNILSFDKALFYAKNYPKIGEFTKEELVLLDELFYEKPTKYGFYGRKTNHSITDKINEKDIEKIPHTGHYLFKGKALNDYNRIKKDVGHDVILTSGVRSIVKQMTLYMKKIYSLNGNITQASYSIAPPAYTYHSISDFDVGKKGFGYSNFTEKFTTTQEYKNLKKLDYISLRYTIHNKEGVRYEPWHIKVI